MQGHVLPVRSRWWQDPHLSLASQVRCAWLWLSLQPRAGATARQRHGCPRAAPTLAGVPGWLRHSTTNCGPTVGMVWLSDGRQVPPKLAEITPFSFPLTVFTPFLSSVRSCKGLGRATGCSLCHVPIEEAWPRSQGLCPLCMSLVPVARCFVPYSGTLPPSLSCCPCQLSPVKGVFRGAVLGLEAAPQP